MNLVVFTSKGDTATKFWFKLGRRSSTFWDKYRDGDQKEANITAIGHQAGFITHDLNYVSNNPAFKPPNPGKKTKSRAPAKATVKSREYQGDLTVASSVEQVKDLKRQIVRHHTTTKEQMPNRSYEFSNARLVPRQTNGVQMVHMPIFNVSVAKEIIPDHGTIDTEAFVTVLREFIAAFTAQDVVPRR